ncbi:DUF3696 domain-containing protein [Fictibacillus sp. 7GRE50]|uniref:DUF3696 domain-containing protein n=1 Tax=Fictibacillus sp. 7GRE50 TaxID=2745878 RepID=UPI0018CD868E|nr:DUF3696 domain-containing protein [Fictibacillus sp. 7GRE50]MBH0164368.1 DUF3696 domain-containing protein [Fictibacillus sp. 7GRE50]
MKTFKLENIKSFLDSGDIEIKPISIFVGRNSSGKSSLLRFPVMLSQTFTEDIFTPFLFFGKQIDYGNFDDVIHNHNGDEIKFSFGFSKKQIMAQPVSHHALYRTNITRDKIRGILSDLDDYSIAVTVTKHNKKIVVKEFIFSNNGSKLFTIIRNTKNKYNLHLHKFIKDNQLVNFQNSNKIDINIRFNKFIPQLEIFSDGLMEQLFKISDVDKLINDELFNKNLIRDLVRDYDFNRIIKSLEEVGFDDRYNEIFSRQESYFSTIIIIDTLLRSLNRIFTMFSNTLSYIGPFRKDPERIYRESESSFMDVGKNGENASMILRQSQQSKDRLLTNVSNWFQDSMGYKINIEEIENSNLFKLMVSSGNGEISHNIMDVGYGVAQVLPIVTQIYYENTMDDEIRRNLYRYGRKKTFIIEQPELHLHPAAQSSLADLFVQKVIDSKGVNILVETHSEHFIRKLQVLVADPKVALTNNDVGIYYVDKMEGHSVVNKINLNSKGQFIEKWPSGFFDKSFELSRELIRVASVNNNYEN